MSAQPDITTCLQALNDKFDSIAADNVITKEEKEAYAQTVAQEKIEIIKIQGDTIEATKQYYEEQREKDRKNSAKVIIGFLSGAAFVTLTILLSAHIASDLIVTYMSSWLGVIVSAILGLIQNGYLQGNTWMFLANFISKIFPKKDPPEPIQEAISNLTPDKPLEPMPSPVVITTNPSKVESFSTGPVSPQVLQAVLDTVFPNIQEEKPADV